MRPGGRLSCAFGRRGGFRESSECVQRDSEAEARIGRRSPQSPRARPKTPRHPPAAHRTIDRAEDDGAARGGWPGEVWRTKGLVQELLPGGLISRAVEQRDYQLVGPRSHDQLGITGFDPLQVAVAPQSQLDRNARTLGKCSGWRHTTPQH
jgi:hypothetical protein